MVHNLRCWKNEVIFELFDHIRHVRCHPKIGHSGLTSGKAYITIYSTLFYTLLKIHEAGRIMSFNTKPAAFCVKQIIRYFFMIHLKSFGCLTFFIGCFFIEIIKILLPELLSCMGPRIEIS